MGSGRVVGGGVLGGATGDVAAVNAVDCEVFVLIGDAGRRSARVRGDDLD